MLAPLAQREILYRLLRGQQGARLRQIAVNNSLTQRVAHAVDWLKRHYAEPLRIETIAQEVCMSPSQFSREYSRLFGAPPLRDVVRPRGAA